MTADAWRTRAACLGRAPLWDSTIDDGGRYAGESARAREQRHRAAIAICSRCPVTEACRADTLWGRDEGVRFGVVLPPLDATKRRAS